MSKQPLLILLLISVSSFVFAEKPLKQESFDDADAILKLIDYLQNNGGQFEPAKDQYHLAKRIHNWICISITYDTSSAYGISNTQDSQVPEFFLTYAEGPRSVCREFTNLFKLLAKEAGIQVQQISGVTKSY